MANDGQALNTVIYVYWSTF